MSEWEGTPWAGTEVQARSAASFTVEFPDIPTQLANLRNGSRPWRMASVSDALGVPGIQRCVTLITNTTGSLSVQAFRNGVAMDAPPQLVSRPNPYETPGEFYGGTAYNMASRGEAVWYIAAFDGDGNPAALVNVPLRELHIEPNQRNRLRPEYQWGNIVSTRWTPATREGRFVHIFYLREPGELRGRGPLQMGHAAVSVSVEAQEWAANFYAAGGYPSMEVHSDMEMDEQDAANLFNQFTARAPNIPLITTGDLTTKEFGVNPQGAQMLDARMYQDGEAARMFGVAGALLEYSAPGSSLTYQNITEVFTLFVKTCLAVNYLEKIEQALSDLLTRSTVARFNVEGFLRADIKTRFEVYEKAIAIYGQEEAAQWAREQEGRAPGNVEFAPVPLPPPAAIPASLPEARSESRELRCDGMRSKRRGGVPQLQRCNALLSRSGVFVGECPKCHKAYAGAA